MPSPDKTRFASHDQYIAAQTPAVQAILTEIQRRVETLVPDAVRCIGYNMPAFRRGKIFFYFAAFKKHIGIYPPVTDDQELIAETARFRGVKGNLSFPYSQELPIDLVGRVAQALAAQYATRSPQAAKKGPA